MVRAAPMQARRPLLPADGTKDGTRRRLLESAVSLFAERGYHGVSVRDITAAVGIQPSALYAHATSKEQLLVELVELANRTLRDEERQSVLAAGSGAVEQLRAFVRALVRFHATYPLLALVGHADLHALPPDVKQSVLALKKEGVDLLKAILDRGIASGDFACADTWLAVAAISGMCVRVAGWYRSSSHPHASKADDFAESVHGWLLPVEYSIDAVENAYADLALAMVRAPAERHK